MLIMVVSALCADATSANIIREATRQKWIDLAIMTMEDISFITEPWTWCRNKNTTCITCACISGLTALVGRIQPLEPPFASMFYQAMLPVWYFLHFASPWTFSYPRFTCLSLPIYCDDLSVEKKCWLYISNKFAMAVSYMVRWIFFMHFNKTVIVLHSKTPMCTEMLMPGGVFYCGTYAA